VGIAGLHYTAMAAMRLPGGHSYSALPVTLSIALAVGMSLVAIALAFVVPDIPSGRRVRYHASTVVRGLANPAMHYTAMAAVTFTPGGADANLSRVVSIESLGVVGISIVPVMVLVVALLTTLADRLRGQRALLDELFEQAPQAVALISADTRVVRVNREFTRVFGYTPQEAVGRRLGDLIIPEEAREEEHRHADLLARGRRVDAEGVRRRKDGSLLHVSIVGVPVLLPGGQVEGYAIYRDVTDRKRADEALRESAACLQTLSRRLLEVQEEERGHLARELHDEVGQMLTGLKFLLSPNGGPSAEALLARCEQARGVVDELLERVRGLSFDLRPAALDQLGLVPALLALFERSTKQTGVRVNFSHSGVEGERFAPEVETTAYRVVQEALTNVARHARVAEAAVRVWVDAGALQVQVEDEGVGFDPRAALAAARSSGLPGMHERVRLVGGRLTIASSPGGGTHLLAELPLAGLSGAG
jgi:PAS domain S-box-containing protein